MSTQKTEHYGLHAWAPEDVFQRVEINENFAAIDAAIRAEAEARGAALAGRGRWVTGTFQGDGADGREIRLAGPILALLLENCYGFRGQGPGIVFGGLILPGAPLSGNRCRIDGAAFIVNQDVNISGYSYQYLALLDLL